MKEVDIQASVTEEIPEWKLKLSYFYSGNKVAIKRGLHFLLFFIDILILFYFAQVYINYQTGAIADAETMREIQKNLVNTEAVTAKKPMELIIESIQEISRGNGVYDLVVYIENPNTNWAIEELKYEFWNRGESLGEQTTFLLPRESKYVFDFNVEEVKNPQFKITGTDWSRIKDYSIVSYKDDIVVKNSTYTPSSQDGIAGSVKITVTNDTPYSFWEMGLPIILYNFKSQIIGVNYVTINKFEAHETRKITAIFHDQLTDQVRRAEVYPEIDLLHKSAIMNLEGEGVSPPGLEY